MKKPLSAALALAFLAVAPLTAAAQTTGSVSKAETTASDTYTPEEIVGAGHSFFGKATRDLATAVEYVFE